MSLNLYNGADEGRWEGMVPLIKQVNPQVLLLQEAVGWGTEPDDPADADRLATAERDLGMRGKIAPTRTTFHTGILVDEDRVSWGDWITKYNHSSGHGHSELTVTVPGLSQPLVLISAHLSPYSAVTAAQEVSVLIRRAHRAGEYGILAGDMNHIPPGDEPPPWDEIPAHNRVARSVIDDDHENLRANHVVGHTLARGGMVDVAAHLADERDDPSLRAWTAHEGKVRVDQVHLTEALLPALDDYWTVPMGVWSDHDGVVVRLDLKRLDATPQSS